MNVLNFSFLSILLLFIVSCQNTTDSNADEEVKKVSIHSSDIFEYNTGISGDEESAAITRQPEYYETSEIVRDSTTNWQAVYRYKASSGFKGTDHAVLRLGTGSNGADFSTNTKLIKIEITVN